MLENNRKYDSEVQKNYDIMIRDMTLEEKARFVNGATFFGSAAIKRLGLSRMQLLDGGTGMNFEQLFGDFYSQMEEDTNSTNGMMGSTTLKNVIENYYHPEKLNAEEMKVYKEIKDKLDAQTCGAYAPGCFPPGILLGATFNKDVVHAVGEALGAEARLFGVNILLGTPNVNIHRDPLNGRLFEGYSEDPCLVATLAPELVKGVQKFDVAANVKHFAANNQETNRVGINETISERALQEIYFPGFKACVQEGKVQTVMSAYNAINGVPCTENHWLLTDLLREEWGFDGMVVSDWGAVYHSVEALVAGNDLAMPGPIDGTPLVKAVEEGRLDEKVLDQAVKRIMEVRDFALWNSFADETQTTIGTQTICIRSEQADLFDKNELYEATKKAAYDAAVEGIVLLKNESQTLPLQKDDVSKVVIVGSGAEQLLECGSGSAGITTNRTSSLAQGLRETFGEQKIIVPKDNGYDYFNDMYSKEILGKVQKLDTKQKETSDMKEDWHSDEKQNVNSDVQLEGISHVVVVAKVSGMEGNDRNDLQLNLQDDMLMTELKELKKKQSFKVILVLNVCGPVDVTPYEEFTEAIMVCFLPGMEGGHALADLVTGKQSPSGKLPLTFPKRYEDTPTFLNFPGDGYEVNYGEGIYVGYRYYDKKKVEPAYPFGFGLSYTTFEIKDLKITDASTGVDNHVQLEGAGEEEKLAKQHLTLQNIDAVTFRDAIKVIVTVRNTGDMEGSEVVQIYISDIDSTLPKPVKELKTFEKVHLQPGESKEVTFILNKEQFASYDMDYRMWIAEEGYYDIIVATSSSERDIVQSERVYLVNKTPYSYGLNSTIKVLYEEPQLKESLRVLWTTKQWDWQIVESNYQYTANRKLSEILPEECEENDRDILAYMEAAEKVVKL